MEKQQECNFSPDCSVKPCIVSLISHRLVNCVYSHDKTHHIGLKLKIVPILRLLIEFERQAWLPLSFTNKNFYAAGVIVLCGIVSSRKAICNILGLCEYWHL